MDVARGARGRRLARWVAAALLVGCTTACAAPAPRATTAPVSPPTAGPRVSDGHTLSLIDPRLRRAWPDNASGPAWFTESGYQLLARSPGEFVAIRAPTTGPVDDVVVRATFRKVGGPSGGGYGVIVRDLRSSAGNGIDQGGEFVVAGVGDRGEVGVWQRAHSTWIDLLPWTVSSAVRPGEAQNELRVEVVGPRLFLDVNGTRVADVPVALESGRVGVYVGGDLNHVQVEQLLVEPQVTAAQADLSGKERQVANIRTRLDTIDAHDPAARRELSGVLASVEQVERDLRTDYSAPVGRSAQHVTRASELARGMVADLRVILELFADGIDSPRSPLNNRAARDTGAERLASATQKAEALRAELQAIRDAGSGLLR